MKKFIISIDAGTTSNRSILFDTKGNPIYSSQKEFTQFFPKSGWVEHNPEEIWSTTLKVLKNVIKRSKLLKGKILTIGITNQRETTILWDKYTGKPVYNAIVWQDRRSADYCNKLIKQKKKTIIYNKTGLLIDAYFSATKIKPMNATHIPSVNPIPAPFLSDKAFKIYCPKSSVPINAPIITINRAKTIVWLSPNIICGNAKGNSILNNL